MRQTLTFAEMRDNALLIAGMRPLYRAGTLDLTEEDLQMLGQQALDKISEYAPYRNTLRSQAVNYGTNPFGGPSTPDFIGMITQSDELDPYSIMSILHRLPRNAFLNNDYESPTLTIANNQTSFSGSGNMIANFSGPMDIRVFIHYRILTHEDRLIVYPALRSNDLTTPLYRFFASLILETIHGQRTQFVMSELPVQETNLESNASKLRQEALQELANKRTFWDSIRG